MHFESLQIYVLNGTEPVPVLYNQKKLHFFVHGPCLSTDYFKCFLLHNQSKVLLLIQVIDNHFTCWFFRDEGRRLYWVFPKIFTKSSFFTHIFFLPASNYFILSQHDPYCLFSIYNWTQNCKRVKLFFSFREIVS